MLVIQGGRTLLAAACTMTSQSRAQRASPLESAHSPTTARRRPARSGPITCRPGSRAVSHALRGTPQVPPLTQSQCLTRVTRRCPPREVHSDQLAPAQYAAQCHSAVPWGARLAGQDLRAGVVEDGLAILEQRQALAPHAQLLGAHDVQAAHPGSTRTRPGSLVRWLAAKPQGVHGNRLGQTCRASP